MKVKIYKYHQMKLVPTNEKILLKCKSWKKIDSSQKNGYEVTHPLRYSTYSRFKYVYELYKYDDPSTIGTYIKLSFWQNQRFLLMQNKHWCQKEKNIKYMVNLALAISGYLLLLKQLK